MVDWKRKLTSRKFWLALIAFIASILAYFNVDGETIKQTTAMIMAGAVVIGYIIGEGLADSKPSSEEAIDASEFYETESEDEDPDFGISEDE